MAASTKQRTANKRNGAKGGQARAKGRNNGSGNTTTAQTWGKREIAHLKTHLRKEMGALLDRAFMDLAEGRDTRTMASPGGSATQSRQRSATG